ncbi:hypothetical protein [Pseudomonas leptonychotis]|uniref:hypothetical protein n=1 Tax=Pseudomonas leptonychotis TaxID=2448482 RepID=UPI0039EF6C0D
MSGAVDFFIQSPASEEALVAFFNQHIPQGVESLECPNDKAAFFLQCFEYGNGFSRCAGLAWGLPDLALDDMAIAAALAREFSTQVLLQPQTLKLPAKLEWCLVDSNGSMHAVSIVELEDGVAVRDYGNQIKLSE